MCQNIPNTAFKNDVLLSTNMYMCHIISCSLHSELCIDHISVTVTVTFPLTFYYVTKHCEKNQQQNIHIVQFVI